MIDRKNIEREVNPSIEREESDVFFDAVKSVVKTIIKQHDEGEKLSDSQINFITEETMEFLDNSNGTIDDEMEDIESRLSYFILQQLYEFLVSEEKTNDLEEIDFLIVD